MSFAKLTMRSPVGKLTLVADHHALIAVLWENEDPNRVKLPKLFPTGNHPILNRAHIQLQEYFSGQRRVFDIPLEFRGTEFQKKIWRTLLKIPFGQTTTYGELAQKIGSPKACRAVGAANRSNPISIIVPCHRVIGAGGNLTGFAGGLPGKQYLLNHENQIASREVSLYGTRNEARV